ncbi:MAG: hypothetical protein D6820_17465, partial [Lentisphaerae bacterium]
MNRYRSTSASSGLFSAILFCTAVAVFAQLEPGGPTAPIAAWNVVPWQRIHAPFNAGVVAFHETGCRVKFTVLRDGKTLQTHLAENPQRNSRVNTWEFFLTLDPKQLGAGPIEIQAQAIPLGQGMQTRELPPLQLYMDPEKQLVPTSTLWVDAQQGDDTTGNGTREAPFKTIRAAFRSGRLLDGGTIYL